MVLILHNVPQTSVVSILMLHLTQPFKEYTLKNVEAVEHMWHKGTLNMASECLVGLIPPRPTQQIAIKLPDHSANCCPNILVIR